ncbi:hypothetical protein [Natronolimnohabitans innermongolicus]|uniref:Uncharacterized protein n=1 Tax=Natronolimnohabitans innermongolicus JCM 12255 TaxID=1227499 RepID=L9WWN8_9EURY|nr:hypothetical protein [Natronolimnohabitans innermongolicus]ELY53837.1 hypothetical protein C493_13678 [Natronolimnohabitans innermongolicus JCM 12255]
MSNDSTSDREDDRESLAEAPTDSIDLEETERVRIGVTRGETDLEIGPPRDYPDRADVSIRPEADDGGGDRIVLSIDAMAGDHGTGHADVELTPAEARTLRDHLDETVRWATDGEAGGHRDR